MQKPVESAAPKILEMSLREFLEQVHPGITVRVTDLVTWKGPVGTMNHDDASFYCGYAQCSREQNFRWDGTAANFMPGGSGHHFTTYACRNCGMTKKLFALMIPPLNPGSPSGLVTKVGEIPAFGVRTMSPRFSAFLGDARDHFFKGRRAESQGMGIGSFGYYRRVVDAQKNKLFDAILEVSKKLNAPAEVIAQLEAAKKEDQFSKGVEAIKGAIPDALYIDGHSPLTLLYRALSKGLHEMTDEECLQRAQAIRVVLTELLQRVDQLVAQDKELKAAVALLLPKA